MFTIQRSMWTTILLHLLAMTLSQIPTLTASTKLTQLTLNLTHTLPPNSNISTFFRHYESTMYSNDTLYPEDIRFPLTRNPDYILSVKVSLGTPPISMNLLMDTASTLTWAQCKPCKTCYTQRYPLYDSLASKTFSKLPCANPLCRTTPYKCVRNECVYNIVYGGGTVIKGVTSTETFYFSTGASASAIPNITFGCSNEIYKADPFARSGNIAGIMGLNRAPHSLLSQLFPLQKRRFSYCFAPFYSGQVGSKTVLRFGDDVPTRTRTLQTTPFLTGFSTLYHLDLLDISVANRRLRILAGTFTPKPKGGGSGIIIDSGALLPQIEKNMGWLKGGKPYSTVISAFEQYYRALRFQKITAPAGLKLELCYRKPAGFNQFASMTYHFRGADYEVDGKYTVIVDERGGYFCVAVMPGNKVSVLGNWHQQNKRLVYDVSMGVLRFGAEDCARDRL